MKCLFVDEPLQISTICNYDLPKMKIKIVHSKTNLKCSNKVDSQPLELLTPFSIAYCHDAVHALSSRLTQ